MEEKPTTQIHSTPSLSGRAAGGASTIHYTLPEVVPYINWLYFFHAWGFPARFAAIAQIHDRDYPELLRVWGGPVLLVGVTYDPKTKAHACRIEELQYEDA